MSVRYSTIVTILAGLLAVPAAAASFHILHAFTGGRGGTPYGRLLADGAGNLYGTTMDGGIGGNGTVFKMTPKGGGKWTETILRAFNGKDGATPVAGLIADGAGALYGTTEAGGAGSSGTAFKLAPPSGGKKAWTETVLCAFGGTKGIHPSAGLIADSAGNLYGTTISGGAGGYGTVFALRPPAAGKKAWTETVLYSFSGGDGEYPHAGLIADSAANLYGTTISGGANGDGTVFALTPPAEGKTVWTETVLHAFGGKDGESPNAGLITDSAGNLYGTTIEGGTFGEGTVYRLTPPAEGETDWTETVLHSFKSKDGEEPYAGLLAGGGGNLYGTALYGGADGTGTLFELTPSGSTLTVLHAFKGNDGEEPFAGLIADSAGNLYGTASQGGLYGFGTVFELTP